MAIPLNDAARRLLDGKNFATIATLNSDGSPQTSVVWVKRDGDTVLFSTKQSRIKARNVASDPRVSLSIFDTANPYTSVDIHGIATLTVDEGRTLPKDLSQKYLGEDPPPEPADVVRLIVRVTPEKVTGFST
ncbi:MAG TPA: PPOX class F420-dependent oxidoreductase [Acidimicrobiales bacterium]|jgi:PPOX class probable F420-dependent enzyme